MAAARETTTIERSKALRPLRQIDDDATKIGESRFDLGVGEAGVDLPTGQWLSAR